MVEYIQTKLQKMASSVYKLWYHNHEHIQIWQLMVTYQYICGNLKGGFYYSQMQKDQSIIT